MKRALPVMLATAIAFPAVSPALERTSAPLADREPRDDWAASTTCSVSYWNRCTGWIWTWRSAPGSSSISWGHQDVIGTVVDPCAANALLETTQIHAWYGAPSGYGHTGFIRINDAAGGGCLGGTLAQQPYLPIEGSAVHTWNVPVSGPVVLNVVLWADDPDEFDFNQSMWVTDHPAAGPTGPPAAGTCYPVPRQARSFYFGTLDSVLCPGLPFEDEVGPAELLWSAQFSGTVSVEARTWSAIKQMYR